MTWQNWVYFGTAFAVTAISSGIVYRVNAETLEQRGKVATNSPKWDKALLGIYWILEFFVIYLIAGLEAKGVTVDAALFWIGMVLYLWSAAIATAALLVNPYLESTARIQTDRGQMVVSRGVYSVVRHPTYSAVLLSCGAVSLVFETPLVRATAAVIAGVMVVRTYLEDEMLKQRLQGYREYSQKTKYRLVPFIW